MRTFTFLTLNSRTQFVVMKRKAWNGDENLQCYRNYYFNSTRPVERCPSSSDDATSADGLAHMIGGLFKRFIMPLCAPATKRFGKQILGNVAKTGIEVVGDVIGRRNDKETTKTLVRRI